MDGNNNNRKHARNKINKIYLHILKAIYIEIDKYKQI